MKTTTLSLLLTSGNKYLLPNIQ